VSSTVSITTARKKLKKAATITVRGRLKPAQAGRFVTVSFLRPGSTVWQRTSARTASNGSFTTTWRTRRGRNRFVAQWPGDELRSGDGSSVLTVTASR
jgi:hypothetical protein